MIASLLLLLVSQDDAFGKTDAQILAMGRSGWYRFYSGKTGEGPTEYMSAQYVYAGALGRRNDRILKGRPVADRKRILALRKEAGGFAEAMTTVNADGGTLDRLTYSDRAVEVEELVQRLARRRYVGVPARKVSDVAKPLADSRPGNMGPAPAALTEARASFGRIAALLRSSPRRESDAVLDFCRRITLARYQP